MKMKVKINNQTFEVTLGDLNARPIVATVDGQTFEVYPEGMPAVQAPAPVIPASSTCPDTCGCCSPQLRLPKRRRAARTKARRWWPPSRV